MDSGGRKFDALSGQHDTKFSGAPIRITSASQCHTLLQIGFRLAGACIGLATSFPDATNTELSIASQRQISRWTGYPKFRAQRTKTACFFAPPLPQTEHVAPEYPQLPTPSPYSHAGITHRSVKDVPEQTVKNVMGLNNRSPRVLYRSLTKDLSCAAL